MGIFQKKKSDLVNQDDTLDSVEIDGDRNSVDVGRKTSTKVKNIIAGIIVIAFGFISVIVFIGSRIGKGGNDEVVYEADNATIEQYNKENRSSDFDLAKALADHEAEEARKLAEEEARRLAEEEARRLARESQNTDDTPDINYGDAPTVVSKKMSEVEKRKLSGNILLDNKSIDAPIEKDDQYNDQASSNNGGANYDSDDFLKGVTFANGSASFIRNRDYLLPSGTVLSCVLKTKVITTYKGLVSCQLSKDIYSDNGKNLLVRAGATLEGTQTEVMMQGQGRVFITWSTIRDRDISIRIDALGTDMLGASGVPAWVDTHFWQRFGNSLMLTFIEDALAIAQTHANKALSADNITMDNFGNQGSRLAEMALENSINIPPTAYINQGELINVVVPRNVDFSTVYKNVNIRRR